VYVKDSIIEARIEKDLKKQRLEGRIMEIERQLKSEENRLNSVLRDRLNRLREELDLLSD
jgi:hypothetical protein